MEKSSATDEENLTKLTAIKKETINDDIKEFAETAMNELLGWYGYGHHHHHREDRSSRGALCRSHSGSNSSGAESPKFNEGCGWCGKTVDENTGLSSSAAVFCSELCFSQSRRANFKKNKTCDWCRHVRHSVSYVDSQDGSSQLQFCSDKCLNQYKMHIFWRETRAHLEIHPHLHGGAGGEESSSSNLITPDLWMNKCKSPEVQPASTPSPSSSPKPPVEQQTSPLPLITVAHPSKLMSIIPHEHTDVNNTTQSLSQISSGRRMRNNKVQKKHKKKCSTLSMSSNKTVFPDVPQDLRIRHTPITITNTVADPLSSSRLIENDLSNQNHRIRGQFNPPMSFPPPNPRFTNRPHPYLNHTGMNNTPHREFFDGLLPPPTLLVPYPVIIPLPIPIPIPIPIPLPAVATTLSEKIRFKDESSQTNGDDDDNTKSSRKDLVIEETKKPALRKRKKIADHKNGNSKVIVKNRETLSV